ncbi:hypothetical protein AVO45_10355 [Ruegeria marisrubri]|uniref:AB hydrolase-1 domain-containing protein n=2 Tax=Ruegeria marisrubri TaxID=1685379 RepID=A0A0X3TR13_9RHOB|nr:hypothetical protein AVO45_10355 [Ruegeria marisrubri]
MLPPDLRGRALTLPGHATRASEPGEFSIEAAAQEIIEQSICERTILVGHSMGTRIAAEIAFRAQPLVHAIILIDGSCVPTNADLAAGSIKKALRTRGKAELVNALINEALPGNLPDGLRSDLTKTMNAMTDEAMVDYSASMANWDSKKCLTRISAITCPVLVLQSTRYTTVAPIRRQSIREDPSSIWYDAWRLSPNTQQLTLPNSGHYLAQERPGAVANAICDFVARSQA